MDETGYMLLVMTEKKAGNPQKQKLTWLSQYSH